MLEIVPVSETISMVQGRNRGRFPCANALLVRDGGVTALVDSGCGHAVIQALLDTHPIDFVICTHSHTDHTSGNCLLAGRPIWMPAGIGFETGGDATLLARRFIADETLHAQWMATTIAQTGFHDAPLTDAYEPYHVFEIGHTRLHTIPAPGHLADHTCIWEPESGVLLATDIDFSRFGPWYANPEGDIAAFEESIQLVRELMPDTVISSHKGVYRDDLDAEFEAFCAHFAARDTRILAALEAPHTLPALVDLALIYGRFPRAGDVLRYFEGEMVSKHLQRLEKRNRVRELEPGLWQRCE